MKLIVIGLVLGSFLQIHIAAQSLTGGLYDCPKPWIDFEDRCYKFVLTEDTIQGARKACQWDGASLLSIHSLQEHEFIANYLELNIMESRKWYTSGKRNEPTSEQFYWESDNTPIESYQYWLNDDVRKLNGTRIAYTTLGAEWGWTLVNVMDGAGNEISRPYICKISKTEIFKILEEERGFEYGSLETDASKFEMGPIFIKQPIDTSFDKSRTEKVVSMDCVADATPDPLYSWYKRKELVRTKINPIDDSRITITNGKITINKPSEQKFDNAEYDCVAENKVGAVRSNTARLSFGYLNDFPKSARDAVVADAFSGVGIECSPPTNGYSYLLYSWFKDSIQNFVRPELKPYTFISHNGKLYFSSVTRDDAGDYFCLVSRPYTESSQGIGKTSMPIPLEVREAVGNEKEPQLASGFPAAFPSAPLQGTNVRIECFAFGTNELFYSWDKLGGPIPSHAIYSDWNRVLTIPNIQMVHGGTYRCSVRRWKGLASQPGDVRIVVEAAPFFTIPLKNQHVDKDSDLTWSAIADGVPAVTYKWYKNAEELDISKMLPDDKARYSIQNNILTIKKIHPEKDAGMYQLAATNSHGTRFSSAQLRILSFAPTFIKYPLQQRQYATLRGNATLLCQPEAAPMGEKKWFKNNRALAASTTGSGRIQQLRNGNLFIIGVVQSDEGMYTCKVTNAFGTAESSGNLTVLPTTTINQIPIDTTVQVNKTAIFQCQASFNPALDITYDWYHNNRKIEFIKIRIIGDTPYIEREDYFERGTGINRGALYIYHTQYYHAGLYRCVAMTTTERITRSAKLHVIGPPFPPVGCSGYDVGVRSLKLKWKIGLFADNGRPITSYVVEGFDRKEGFWKTMKTHIKGQALVDKETAIDSLSPFSTYKFRVTAENVLGLGNPSKESEWYTTGEAKPEIAPPNVGRCVGKVGTLCISWEPIPPAQQNGNGFGYVVKYKKSYIIDEEWTTHTLIGAEIKNFVALVGQQNFYKQYDVTIQGFNNKGYGPESPSVTIRSAMGIPTGQPTQLRVWQYNCTALYAEWDPVQDTIELLKGKLTGYRVNYWRECCETENEGIFNQYPGQRDHGLIIGLYPDTSYYVNVQVVNEAGYGPKTDEISQHTLRSAPKESPQEVKVYVQSWNSIKVTWRGVSTGIEEEPLEGYRIIFWRQSESRYQAEQREAYKHTELVVNDLDPNIYYELRVFAYSRGGDGLMSSPMMQFILGPNCWVREDSPESEYIYKCHKEKDHPIYPGKFSYWHNASSYVCASSLVLTLAMLLQLFVNHL